VTITESEIRSFEDIFHHNVDLVMYYHSHGTDESGNLFVEFLVPVDILPPEKINKKAFKQYRGTIRPQDVRIVKDSTGIFDKFEVTPYYILTLTKS
jgi:hypothetical protein